MAKPILSKKQLAQMQKKRARHEGHKVITDDVKKLKSLAIEADLTEEERINHYREPVEIEYYIPKESRFQVDIKYLYIQLVDPEPRNEDQRQLYDYFKSENSCFDIVAVMNQFPQYLMPILETYDTKMDFFESLSQHLIAGKKGELGEYKRALYMFESQRQYEPTVCSLEILGDYTTLAINFIIRELNRNNIEFYLEDTTVSNYIKLYTNWLEKQGEEVGERFAILAELFYQQAYPHRGQARLEDLLL